MEQRGQESQLERCPLLHSRNSFQDSLGRSGESDHEEQEEICGLEMMVSVAKANGILSLPLCLAASVALTKESHLSWSYLCFKNSSPFLNSTMGEFAKSIPLF